VAPTSHFIKSLEMCAFSVILKNKKFDYNKSTIFGAKKVGKCFHNFSYNDWLIKVCGGLIQIVRAL